MSLFGYTRGQKTEIDSYLIKLQWTVFVTSDTTYNVTKYINEDGVFWFRREFNDTATIESKFFNLQKEFDGKKQLKTYREKYHLINKVDTIHSYYAKNIKYSDKKYFEIGHEGYVIDDLLEDVSFSYILKVLNKTSIPDSVIVLLFPIYDLGFSPKYYILMLDYSFNKNINFYCYTGISRDLSGFQINKIDSATVKNKKLSNIIKQTDLISQVSSKSCLRPGTPWLLILKDKKFVISDFCLRREKDDTLKEISILQKKLLRLKLKYLR